MTLSQKKKKKGRWKYEKYPSSRSFDHFIWSSLKGSLVLFRHYARHLLVSVCVFVHLCVHACVTVKTALVLVIKSMKGETPRQRTMACTQLWDWLRVRNDEEGWALWLRVWSVGRECTASLIFQAFWCWGCCRWLVWISMNVLQAWTLLHLI